jgi:DNA-binding FadR family transcriptional regulator
VITPAKVTPQPLTDRQRLVLSIIAQYYVQNQEPITIALLARKLGVSRTTAHEHVRVLHQKGWLPAPAAPATRADNLRILKASWNARYKPQAG